jgi:hypothetical protein
MEEDQTILFWETDRRFWDRTNYKRGHRLNMSDPTDRQMAGIWRQIFAEVRSFRDRATRDAFVARSKDRSPYVIVFQMTDGGHFRALTFKQRKELEASFKIGVETPEMYSYVAMYDFTKNPRGFEDDHFASAMPPSRHVSGWWYGYGG